MKRTALFVALALGVGLAIGASAREKKFKYLPDRWSRPMDITEIELACMVSSFSAEEPVPIQQGRLLATKIEAKPVSTHIQLTAQVKLIGTERGKLQKTELDAACAVLYKFWHDKLLRKPLPRPPATPVTIDLCEKSKVIYRLVHNRSGQRGYMNPST